MFIRDQLTHEKLRGIFKNNFELANYAIRLGTYLIRSGHEVTLDGLLEEIRKNPSPSYLDDLKRMDQEDADEDASE
ncbi:MAG: hypothetical protein NT065_00810 [Chlamydiae bacterium]|jgi:hypothetical protein|nr:hypothetical protein [Chlamydiota bacterium]